MLHKIDYMVMNNISFSFLYSLLFRTLNGYLICCIATKNTRFDVRVILISSISIILTYLFRNNIIVFIYDFFSLFLLCYKESSFKEYLLTMLLNTVYQLISLFIRGLVIQLSYYPVVEEMLLNLDYYILLVITYLYLKKGDKKLCSIVQAFYSSLASKLWRKPSENYLNKDSK